MPSNANDTNFDSNYLVDKVVYENKDTPLTYSVGATTNVTQTVTNSYGAACFITMAWSIDGTNYYSADAVIPAAAYTTAQTANAWVDATTVYIYLENNSAGAVTFSVIYALDTIT